MKNLLVNGPQIILDVEATCWETSPIDRVSWMERGSEVIEIGIYVPSNLDVPGAGKSASFMIRPVLNPILSPFCTNLTSITQEMVDAAKGYVDALKDVDTWCVENIGTPLAETPWSSWGFYDLNILSVNSRWFNSPVAFSEQMHMNVKEMARRVSIRNDGSFALMENTKIGKFSVSEAIRFFNLGEFQGTQHRGVDDAINIGRIWETISELFGHRDFVRHAAHSSSISESFLKKNGPVRPKCI